MSTDPWQSLADHAARQGDAGAFSGRVLVTVAGRAVVDAAAGLADRANGIPVTPDSRFGLASMSKMFTAAAVLLALSEHGVDVRTPVRELLPEDRRPGTLGPAVTVHHLLTHTSGIGDYAEEDEDVPGYVEDYGSLWRQRPVHAMLRPDDFLPLYAEAAPVAPPGEAFHYSNAGFVLLGALLEELTGGQFTEVVTRTVLEPAGMAGSGYFRSDEARPDLAPGWLPPQRDGEPWRSNVFSVPVVGGGDGGAWSTASDIDRFLRALAGGDLLGPELTARMLSRHVQVEEDMWMGYGLFVMADRFGHGGGDPGVETYARYFPGRDAGVVVLANLEGSLGAVYDQAMQAVEQLPERKVS